MKKVKMTLSDLTGKLTKNEMRYVLAGSGTPRVAPYSYWDYVSVPYNSPVNGVNAGNSGIWGAVQFVGTVAANVGIAVVNGAAAVGNTIAAVTTGVNK